MGAALSEQDSPLTCRCGGRGEGGLKRNNSGELGEESCLKEVADAAGKDPAALGAKAVASVSSPSWRHLDETDPVDQPVEQRCCSWGSRRPAKLGRQPCPEDSDERTEGCEPKDPVVARDSDSTRSEGDVLEEKQGEPNAEPKDLSEICPKELKLLTAAHDWERGVSASTQQSLTLPGILRRTSPAASASSGLSRMVTPAAEPADEDSGSNDDASSVASGRSLVSCSTLSSFRGGRRRKRQLVPITATMEMQPSAALQLIIDNPGDITEFYKFDQKILGEGSFGSVRKASVKATGALRAVKAVAKEKMKEKIGLLKMEIGISKSVDHPNLIKLYEIFEDTDNLYLVLELCTGGHLQAQINKRRHIPEKEAAVAMVQILRAVFYLHTNHIVHRDLKPENVLIVSKDPFHKSFSSLKVSDFGLSCACKSSTVLTSRAGTPAFMAPEILNGKYSLPVDAWSCGVIMYVCLSGDLPFAGKNKDEIFEKIKKGALSFSSPAWVDIHGEAIAMLSALMDRNSKTRSTIRKALKYDWLELMLPKAKEPPIKPQIIKNLRNFRRLNRLKRAALSVIASMLAEKEIDASREIFISLDQNGDGNLSIKELKRRLQSTQADAGLEDLEGIFVEADAIDARLQDFAYTEFLAATFDRKRCLTREVVLAAFRSFDKNGDGNISMSELAEGRLLGQVGLEELAETLDDLDKNGDCYVDFEEFLVMMRDH